MNTQKTSRQLQAERTRRDIFDAAMRLLDIQDFESITVRDIVREAGVSIGSFYNSYPSKLDVFYETYYIADEYFVTVVAPALAEPSCVERVIHFFREYAVYNAEYSPFALTKVLFNANNKNFHRHEGATMLSVLTDIVRQAQDSDEFSNEQDALDIADFLMVCIRGLVYDWCTCDGAYDLKERICSYVDHLLKIFQAN